LVYNFIRIIEPRFEVRFCYKIDKVLDIRQAASLKAGGAGIRYKIRVRDRETYLFLEENKTGDRWFMERKTS